MNPEAIEKIATIISSLGADAKEGLIWYMVFWFVYHVISVIITSATVVVCFKIIANLIKHIVHHCCASSQLAEAAGVTLTANGWDSGDLAATCEILRHSDVEQPPMGD